MMCVRFPSSMGSGAIGVSVVARNRGLGRKGKARGWTDYWLHGSQQKVSSPLSKHTHTRRAKTSKSPSISFRDTQQEPTALENCGREEKRGYFIMTNSKNSKNICSRIFLDLLLVTQTTKTQNYAGSESVSSSSFFRSDI